jgi:hypothetical protein
MNSHPKQKQDLKVKVLGERNLSSKPDISCSFSVPEFH